MGGKVHLPSGKPKNIKIKSNQREEVAFFLLGVYFRVKKKKRNGL